MNHITNRRETISIWNIRIFTAREPLRRHQPYYCCTAPGNEQDLLPLAEMISPTSNVLGVRGNVLENGMPRFFRRLAEGVFDLEDLVKRTHDLNEFLNWAAAEYDFDRSRIVAVGYSNGANIAASLLFHEGDALQGPFSTIRWFRCGIRPCRI